MCCLCILTSPERAQVRSMRAFGKLEKIPGVYVSLSVFDEEFESLCVILECSKAKKVLASAVGEIEQSRFRGLLCNASQTVDY